MKILNSNGKSAYRDWINDVKSGFIEKSNPPYELLQNELTSFEIYTTKSLPNSFPENKFDFIKSIEPALREILNDKKFDRSQWHLVYDTFSLLTFSQICKKKKNGNWDTREISKYIFDPNPQRRYRHLIAGPYTMIDLGGDEVEPFLQSKPSIFTDFEENIGSRQQLVGNRMIISLLRRIYLNEDCTGLKRGYSSRKKYRKLNKTLPKGGAIQRFGVLMNQFSRVYDIHGSSELGLTTLLPSEFNDWLEN